MTEANEPVVVYSGNILEAELVKSLLEAEGVLAFLQDQVMGTLAPFLGTVKVIVAAKDFSRAQDIVKQLLEEESGD